MAITARVAPVILAKTSKTSALLVVVKNACINSIEIPKINEKKSQRLKAFGTI